MNRQTEPTTQPYTLFFVHIPKTAGSTFQKVLARVYEGDPCYCNVYPNWEEARKVVTTYGWSGRLSAMAGHFPFGLHREAGVPPLIEDDVRCITFLRDPVHRVVSQYNHVMNSDVPEHQGIFARHPTLESFLAHPWARDIQVYFVSGWKHDDILRKPEEATRVAIANLRDQFSSFGLTERFDESLILFADALGWTLPTYTSTNLASERASRIHVEDLSPSLIARIQDVNRCDLALYEYARSLFNDRCSATPSLESKLIDYQARLAGGQPVGVAAT